MKMKVTVVCIILSAFAVNLDQAVQYCPSGSEIYEWGITQRGQNDIVNEHNKYRQQILDGKVPNQPRGKNIAMMSFDDKLAQKSRKVSETCQMNHILATDDRWSWVGQNLYIGWSSAKTPGQDWVTAAASWFNERKYFTYPNKSTGTTGHYTQLIWHNSQCLGCDFIWFYDKAKPQYPYAKLYTCNYGPGGNWRGQPPYELA